MLLRIPGLVGKVFSSKRAFVAMLDELLTEHKTTWDPAQPPRDLTEAFLAEMEKVIGSSKRCGQGLRDEGLGAVMPEGCGPVCHYVTQHLGCPGHNGRPHGPSSPY